MKKLTIIKWMLEVTLLIAISIIYYLNQIVTSPTALYVPKGSIAKIITYLEEKRYEVTDVDAFLLRYIGNPQGGWLALSSTKMRRGDFLYQLTTAKSPMADVTLIPGETTEIFLDEIAVALELNAELLKKYFIEYAPMPEGVFVPNTYRLPIGISEKAVIVLLLNQSLNQMKEWSNKIFGTFNQTKWFTYIAIASVIQKEAASNEEMPLISSVIYNRLNKNMKLQMDGTLNYGIYSHVKVTPERIKEDESIYNTYKVDGIPKYPVCNVSVEAIKAAIFPQKSDYLYFVKGKNGKHVFSSYYSTHLTNINAVTK